MGHSTMYGFDFTDRADYQQKINNHPTKKHRNLYSKYGITLEQFLHLIEEQDNKCARCGKPFVGEGREKYAPCVDHDHSYPKGDPNAVKSILHNYCNIMMGSHNDSIPELELSIVYQKKNSKVV